ncbi:MAG TPA: hypothetical protein VG267_01290 [Terracidiphilus sp.]|jgi:hypothetical protein|nr:hypothetical protein [Terracidiphilus sp.]
MANGNDAGGHAAAAEGNEAAAGGILSRENLKYLAGVAIAGAIGGLLYWVLARFTGTSIPGNFGPAAAVFALMFVGAVAAAIGVYLLTASDPTDIRTYIFAMVCGLMWQPVIASGQQLVTNATATRQNSTEAQTVQNVQTATKSGNVEQINTAVQQTVPAVTTALATSAGVSDTEKKTQIADTSKQAIDQIQSASAKAPDASVDALQTISTTAATSGQSAVAIHGIQALNTIAAKAEKEHNRALELKVRQSLLSLAQESKDPTVQNSARMGATQLKLE